MYLFKIINNYNLQSSEVAKAVYVMDWNVLTHKSKMDLARRPKMITGSLLITISLVTLINVSFISHICFIVKKQKEKKEFSANYSFSVGLNTNKSHNF